MVILPIYRVVVLLLSIYISAIYANFFCDFVPTARRGIGLSSWSANTCSSSTSYCTWTGVTCTSNVVSGLALSGKSLTGTLPSSIGDLTGLQTLTLWGNRLNGTLPASITYLNKLVSMTLNDNSFTGSLPLDWTMVSLRTLYAYNNRLTGSIPNSFSSMTSLRDLRLHGNLMSAVYPAAMCGFSALNTFYMSHTALHECNKPTSSLTPPSLTPPSVSSTNGILTAPPATVSATSTLVGATNPPVLTTCQTADDMSHIVVNFDGATDRGGVKSPYACDAVILFAGADVSTCSFNSDGTSLKIFPSLDITIPTSTVLTLRPSIIRAACPLLASASECSKWPSAPKQSCSVQAAHSPITPTVTISAPSIIGVCNDFMLDVTASIGAAGKDWASFAVTVSGGLGLPRPPDAADIENFYNTVYVMNPPTPLPASYLTDSTTYVFTITMCNSLGICGSAKHSLDVASIDVPLVTIQGSPVREIRSAVALNLVSNALVQFCDGSTTTEGLSYTWLVYEGELPAGFISISKDSTKFQLNPYTLSVGHAYQVILTVEYDGSPLAASTTVLVSIARAYVNAQLTGASSRSLRFGDVLQLDASSSSDDDVAGVSGAAAGLLFAWSCQSFRNNVPIACILSIAPNAAIRDLASVQFTTTNTTGVISRVAVNVSDATRQRYDTAYVDIEALPPLSPTVTLSSETKRVILAQRVRVLATVEVFATTSAQWLISDKTINLASLALTPTTATLATGRHTFNLVVTGNALYSGASFTFSLVVGNSISSIKVDVIGPPIVGKFSVSPPKGYALETYFTLLTSRWQDTELPLTYSFGFVTAQKNTAVLLARSELTFFDTILSSSGGSVVRCVVTGYNALHAYSSTFTDVTLLAKQITVDDVNNMLSAVLTSDNLLPRDVKRAVAIGSASLNTVNCSLSPDCASLNRENCAATPHTCGSCLDGFLGMDGGDANSLCFSANGLTVSNSSVHCTINSDCDTTAQFCNGNGTCQLLTQNCMLDCSGLGTCFLEDISTGMAVAECLVGDVTCSARCVCDVGYSGAGCLIPLAEIESRRDSRRTMINLLRNASRFDDVSVASVLELVDVLTELSASSNELTRESCETLEDMVETALSSANALSMTYDELTKLYSVVDSCVNVNVRDGHTPSSAGIDQYLDTIRKGLVVGQQDVIFIESMSRSASVSENAKSGVTVRVPMTTSEQAVGKATAELSMNGTDDDAGVVSVTAIESRSRLYNNGSEFSSDPVQVQFYRVGPTPGRDTVFRIVFPNRRNQAYGLFNISNMNFTTACEKGDFSWHNYSCPAGGRVSHKCTGSVVQVSTPCPPVKIDPSCRLVIDRTVIMSDTCSVVAYTGASTTCECVMALKVSDTRHRRATEADDTYENSGGVEVVSMASYTYDEFVDTLFVTDDLTVGDLQGAILVIVMFVVLWAIGLLALIDNIHFTLSSSVVKERVRHRHRSSAIGTHSLAGQATEVEERKRYLMAYLNTIFPAVFTESENGLKAMWIEIKKHHRYSQIFFATGPTSRQERAQSVVQMLTVQTMLMFLLAVFYDLEYPTDNGVCDSYTTKHDCLEHKSIFDSSSSLCSWKERTSNDGSVTALCYYVQPSITIRVIVLISILIACCTAPINLVVDYLFDGILSAPTADEHKMTLEANIGNTYLRKMERRFSQAARRVSAAAVGVAKSTGDALKIRKSSTFVLNETTRVVPDNVIHLHALASTALGQSLAEAFALRESSTKDFSSLYERSPSMMSRVNSDVESGVACSSRHMQRVHGIISTALSFSDETSSVSPMLTARDLSKTMSSDEDILAQLCGDMKVAYNQMSVQEQNEFVDIWGWDPLHAEFVAKNSFLPFVCSCSSQLGNRAVRRELQAVRRVSNEKYDKLKIATDIHVGMELVHIFVCDLLGWGTPAQIIFETKTSEEFRHSMVVTRSAKLLAWIAIVVMNLAFVGFSVVRGMTRSYGWQKGYVVACCIQLFIEIFLYESSECLWIHYIIPRLVSADVSKILTHMEKTIQVAFSTNNHGKRETLDSSSYFFISSQLAEKFPQLFESLIILSYHSQYPPLGSQVGIKWKHPVEAGVKTFSQNVDNTWLYRINEFLSRFSVLLILGNILRSIGTIHIRIQKVILHTLQPLFVSFVVVLIRIIAENALIAAIVASVVVLELLLYELRLYFNRRREKIQLRNETAVLEETLPAGISSHTKALQSTAPDTTRKDSGQTCSPEVITPTPSILSHGNDTHEREESKRPSIHQVDTDYDSGSVRTRGGYSRVNQLISNDDDSNDDSVVIVNAHQRMNVDISSSSDDDENRSDVGERSSFIFMEPSSSDDSCHHGDVSIRSASSP